MKLSYNLFDKELWEKLTRDYEEHIEKNKKDENTTEIKKAD